jgi:hypothetical protein
MFRDSRVADRQHTAASFSQLLRRYANKSESWYDGSVGSVDARLARCDQLLHSARFTVARVDIADAGRYLGAVQALDNDRRSLLALRDDLLTGGANRTDVVGPAGWRTAEMGMGDLQRATHDPGFDAHADEAKRTEQARGYVERERARMPDDPTWNDDWKPGALWGTHEAAGAPGSGGAITSPVHQPAAPDSGTQAPQNTLKKMPAPAQKKAGTGGPPPWPPGHGPLDPGWVSPVAPRPPSGAPSTPVGPGTGPGTGTTTPWPGPGHDAIDPNEPLPPSRRPGGTPVPGAPPGWVASLHGADRRWVSLESAKFIAANSDTLDDSHELATRAQAHAAMKTSTFTPARSAEICRAFVASVVDLGRQTYRPHVVRTAAAAVDFDDSMLYLA